jgi:hypothetical protein
MERFRYTKEQIVVTLNEIGADLMLPDACRKIGVRSPALGKVTR